jgi:hypothetical protein
MDHIVVDSGYWDDGRPKQVELLHQGDDVPSDIPADRIKELEAVGAIGDPPQPQQLAHEPQLPGPPTEEEAEAARKTPAVREEIRLSRDRVTTASATAGRPLKEGAWKDMEKGTRRSEGAEQPTHHTGGAQHNR